MNAAANSRSQWPSYQVLASLSVSHAVTVLILGAGAFLWKWPFADARLWWAALGWAWTIWFFVLFLHPMRTRKQLAVTLVLGLTVLLPCLPLLLALAAALVTWVAA